MLAPPTWFDFSAECIYTAQKQKKNKSWRDGLCTCCFERGWVVLKLFPEGASITSEPLEVWRLAPNTPEAVAQQEIELQVHLVQLLGNPQPLRGQKKLQAQPQPHSAEVQKAPGSLSSSNSQSAASVDRVKVLPKRRLAGGLPRPNGVSPQGFRRPAPVPPQEAGFGRSVLNESGWKELESAHPQSHRSTGTCAPFVPPLLRPAEEPPSVLEPLPLEEAWAVNGAKALLSSICLCCGGLDCCHFAEPCVGTGSGVADFFRGLFNDIQTGALPQLRQLESQADLAPPKIQEIYTPADEGDTLDEGNSQSEPWTAVERCPAAVAAPSRQELHSLEANSNTAFQYGAPVEVAAEGPASVQREGSHAPPRGCMAVPSAAASFSAGAPLPVSSGAGSPRNTERRSRFFALAGGCVPPAHCGAQVPSYINGQGSANISVSRANGLGPGAACVRSVAKPAGLAPYVGSNEAAGARNCAGQTATRPELQQHLQVQQREPCQPGKLQQFPPDAGSAVQDPPPEAPPLLLAEELPDGQLESLVDFVPVTFCTAPTETPPFNAAFAAARHLFLSTSLEGTTLRANQLALRYFNSILVSLQAALTETAQNISWSNGTVTGSPGVGEVRFLLEGACIRLDGKHHSGFQQRVAEAHRQRKAKQQQLRRSHQLRQRKRRRIDSGKAVSSESETDDQEDTSDGSECEAGVPRQPGLLLDLSRASILSGPPKPVLEGHPAQKRSSMPFEKAASIKEQLGRNDIWAFSTDDLEELVFLVTASAMLSCGVLRLELQYPNLEPPCGSNHLRWTGIFSFSAFFSEHFEDWSKVVLARSMWRGASPHTCCIKVSVLGPWPAAQNPLRVPLIRFAANGQFTRAALPAPPPLLLQIRQLLQGRCRAIGGVKAIWVGRLHDELSSIEACQRLFRAEMALKNLKVVPELNLKCLDTAVELGRACAARVIGLGCQGFGAETGREAETTVTQLIMLDVSSEDAEAVVCKCSSGGGSWMLNEEQQRVIIAISRWFGYTDGRRPFGPRDEAQLHEKQHGDAEGCENQVNRSENSQELQQGDSSIFSQDNKHSALQSKSQATPSEKQEKAGDLNSSAVAVQGSNTGGAPAVSPDDDDIADICLYADDLDELQLPGEECSGVGIASAEDRRPEENSGFRLDQPSAVVKDRNVQDPRTATLASTAHDSLAVGSEAKTCTPLQDENSKVGVADGEKQFKAQPAQHPPKETGPPATLEPPPVSVTLASSLASTAVNMPASSAPVFLVQGVFGAGKTTMLAASLATLCRLLDLAKSRSRVLLVCATNAAVDGVLLRLLRQYECCDFARIGRLSEMQPALLPYAICSSAARNTAVHEFKAVLSGLLSAPGGRANLATMAKQLLQSIDSGSFPPSMQQWKRRRIWATTCSSFASSDLFSDGGFRGAASEGTTASFFPFLLMDEASQVAEPLAAAVLTRAHPLRCIFLGDTRQLPPTTRLRGPVSATASSLFSRLLHRAALPSAANETQSCSAQNVEEDASQTSQSSELPRGGPFFSVFQMRLQYRCHPDLGRLAAELFYGAFVAHGVSAAQRLPLLPEWRGALCLALVRGSRETKAGRSLINAQEAAVVARLVQHALQSKQAAPSSGYPGLAGGGGPAQRPRPEDLGVICFYRAQADEVKRHLLRVLPKAVVDSVQISTVDAFQGSEKEVIFLSLVRSHAHVHGAASVQQQLLRGGTPDFLTCPHRVCVALTRAKRQLVIVAADTFIKQQSGLWSRVCSRATQLHI